MKQLVNVSLLVLLTLAMSIPAFGQADTTLVVTSSGNVGIGTPTPTSKLKVVGDVEVIGKVKVARDESELFREMSIWVGLALDGTSCNDACGNGACLVAYKDRVAVEKVSCEVTTPNKNCLCVGRQ